jgi:hypothetical protein
MKFHIRLTGRKRLLLRGSLDAARDTAIIIPTTHKTMNTKENQLSQAGSVLLHCKEV